LQDVLTECRLSVANDLLASDVLLHGPEGVVHGLEGAKSWIEGLHRAFSGFSAHSEYMIAENDRVVARVTIRAAQMRPFAGIDSAARRIVLPLIMIMTFGDGRIREIETFFDSRIFQEELGEPIEPLRKL
jgi:predicted ester cyclase